MKRGQGIRHVWYESSAVIDHTKEALGPQLRIRGRKQTEVLNSGRKRADPSGIDKMSQILYLWKPEDRFLAVDIYSIQ